jgi:hypothetical protein
MTRRDRHDKKEQEKDKYCGFPIRSGMTEKDRGMTGRVDSRWIHSRMTENPGFPIRSGMTDSEGMTEGERRMTGVYGKEKFSFMSVMRALQTLIIYKHIGTTSNFTTIYTLLKRTRY